ncbi:MAG: hypothetical protein IKL07_09610 [Clostridium sp.]|nr:hypothetical protein [Clostridium sp.]
MKKRTIILSTVYRLRAAGVLEEHVLKFLDRVQEMKENIKTAPSMKDGCPVSTTLRQYFPVKTKMWTT